MAPCRSVDVERMRHVTSGKFKCVASFVCCEPVKRWCICSILGIRASGGDECGAEESGTQQYNSVTLEEYEFVRMNAYGMEPWYKA